MLHANSMEIHLTLHNSFGMVEFRSQTESSVFRIGNKAVDNLFSQ